MSLEILLEAALFVERQTQGEEPNGQPDHTLIGEDVGTKLVYNSSGSALRIDETTSSVINNGAYSLDHPHVTSVIQRSGPSPPSSSSYAAIGSRHAAAFYSYQQTRSRSPSPARGAHCNGSVNVANGQRTAAASPLHSHSVSNGSSAASSQRSYQSSPKMQDAEPFAQQPSGYLNSVASSSNHHSSSSSSTSSSTHPSFPRVDDLASRSHRLEEALLRASRKSPPMPLQTSLPAATAVAASSSSSSSSSSATAAHFNAANSGRTSADELLELKKRSGAGTREVHNKLEKNRRAHLRECFEFLRKQLPAIDDKKLSNLGILKSALRHIQTLKRKEREYEHTMERLAREKIAAQQRLAALRKEVPSIPGYSGDAGSLDLTSVVPVVLHSQQVQMIHQSERDSPLTFANVQAHTIREENHYRLSGGASSSSRTRDGDQESNSGTSTASEGGDASDGEAPTADGYAQRRAAAAAARPPTTEQLLTTASQANGRPLPASPVPGSLKRPHAVVTNGGGAEELGSSEADHSRPHIRYVRASTATTSLAYATTTTMSHPAATYVTMVPTTAGGVLELTGVPIETREGAATMPGGGTALYHVRHPAMSSAIAFATSATGHHVQLATPQVLAAHHGVQLLTHGPSLKLLTAGPTTGSVRVIAASDVSTSLQPLMAVHTTSSVTGSKNSEEIAASLLNGTAATSTSGTVFCTPSGVVIPSLVALPPTEASASNNSNSSSSSSSLPTNYELPRVTTSVSTHLKNSSTIPNSSAVLSLPNGLLKATVSRSLQPVTTAGVAHVMTPIAVTRSLPLVTNMAVVGQPAKHVAHILTNSSLDKMGLLKSGSIPIIGGQYLTPATGRHLIKPVVVVAASPSTSPTTTQVVVAPRDGSTTANARPSTPQTKYPPT
ncbi:mucin-2-like isoform X2 [Daphnia carinata]|uniref:mucin-2-like isoform X2 n=1 Tax=Daphnia carinata TaxID=120202 RepID=UPI0028692D72|nr:mucin-2-like isoform X2 [Daphnia carinata]XP_059353595.1 mucin-2-like isoform X2 [Daphnia carinata]XP_059353596.1 mucin-2-like isoform X2 [Daphnia carinata]